MLRKKIQEGVSYKISDQSKLTLKRLWPITDNQWFSPTNHSATEINLRPMRVQQTSWSDQLLNLYFSGVCVCVSRDNGICKATVHILTLVIFKVIKIKNIIIILMFIKLLFIFKSDFLNKGVYRIFCVKGR